MLNLKVPSLSLTCTHRTYHFTVIYITANKHQDHTNTLNAIKWEYIIFNDEVELNNPKRWSEEDEGQSELYAASAKMLTASYRQQTITSTDELIISVQIIRHWTEKLIPTTPYTLNVNTVLSVIPANERQL